MIARDPSGFRINVGCGLTRPTGWVNMDSSLNSYVQGLPIVGRIAAKIASSTKYDSPAVYVDLRETLPFADGSVSIVYASHVLEHLSLSQADRFLQEALRVLSPGGCIRIVVPDLEALSRIYLQELDAGKTDAASKFLEQLNLHQEGTYTPNRNPIKKLISGIQGHPHQHKYMYDSESLKSVLRRVGFSDPLGSGYGRSNLIDCIEDVECTAEGVPSVYLEAAA